MSEIQLYDKLQNQDPLKAVQAMGAMMAKSGMFGCQRAEQGEVLAMVCMTENMTPIQVTNKFHIIDGKLSRKSGSALAEFKQRGGRYKWIRTGQEPDQDLSNREAIGEFTLNGESVTVRFSIEEAKLAGLIRLGSAWEKLPWKMLRARVTSDALGMIAPEIYFGDDIEETPAEPRTIKLGGDAVKTDAPAEPTQPKPIEVQADELTVFDAEVVTEKAKPAPQPEPKPEPKPEPQPEPTGARELPSETVTALQKAIGADGKVAMIYLYSKGWLKKGENLEHLTPARANKIIQNTTAFIDKCKEVAK
jgi:hypothetical protein